MRKILFTAAACAALCSCGVAGVVADTAGVATGIASVRQKGYQQAFTLPMAGDAQSSMDRLSAVLEADGWRKTSQTATAAAFVKKGSMAAGMALGKYSSQLVYADFSRGEVKVTVAQQGNYSTAGEEATARAFEKIKADYLSH